ncbi:hypothetical protein TNIN_296861 [Trichonephila inaurata madagascariensis]|uniref:Glycine-rich protein n=1 Tax=Trichonephila inaurata madagascariensis TaxID=2747483 RepID=A0A8X6MKM8_9ARAC|nr:hypothetical protein TNIN_296861 [Trichonephila inaurata madagascariensis]
MERSILLGNQVRVEISLILSLLHILTPYQQLTGYEWFSEIGITFAEACHEVDTIGDCFSSHSLAPEPEDGGGKMKKLIAASVLAGALKPRFVPLPIPIPFKIKIKKGEKIVPYPVKSYGGGGGGYGGGGFGDGGYGGGGGGMFGGGGYGGGGGGGMFGGGGYGGGGGGGGGYGGGSNEWW